MTRQMVVIIMKAAGDQEGSWTCPSSSGNQAFCFTTLGLVYPVIQICTLSISYISFTYSSQEIALSMTQSQMLLEMLLSHYHPVRLKFTGEFLPFFLTPAEVLTMQ